MSLVEERRPERVEGASQEKELISSSSRRVLVIYPGERVAFSLVVNGPLGHRVNVYAKEFPQSVASIIITPENGVAPFTSEIEIQASVGASPGLYYFDLQITDQTKGRILGTEPLGILILPRNLPRDISRHYKRLRRMYKETGAQGVLWYLIAKIFKNGISFTELKNTYELVRGNPVKKATIAVILRRMIRKGLIKKGEDRKYYPVVTRAEIAFSRIDKSRVRVSQLSGTVKKVKRQEMSAPKVFVHEPYVAKLAFKRARKIAQKHGNLAAAYFLVYSLVGARETGVLLV